MSKRIYVGNLPLDASEDDVRSLFSEFGTVVSVRVITDRDTGRPRGFGFVEMADGAEEAIEALNLKQRNGHNLNVSEARPSTARRISRQAGW